MKFPFGRHEGEEIEDIPEDYLRWALENCTLTTALINEMEAQLTAKRGEGIVRQKGRLG